MSPPDRFVSKVFFYTEFDLHVFFQAARDVSGHSPKTRTFKHTYTKQILAADFISVCQTKEWLNMGHPCITIADPYIVPSLPCFTIGHSGEMTIMSVLAK